MPLFACYHKCFVYSFLQAYRVVLCNETIPFMLQNEHFCSHIDYILRSVIIFSLCKRATIAIQKSLFCTAKQALLDCKNYTFATSRYSCYFFEEIFSHYEYIAVVFFFHQKKVVYASLNEVSTVLYIFFFSCWKRCWQRFL